MRGAVSKPQCVRGILFHCLSGLVAVLVEYVDVFHYFS
jgi:hypothetical protein